MRRSIFFILFIVLGLHSGFAQHVQYRYDELGRVQSVTSQNGESALYHYDANGNITSIDRYAANQIAILGFSPASGAVGAQVTVYGNNFSPQISQNTLMFNGTTATIAAASATQLVVSVPVGATTGSVSISAPSGQATSAIPFTVISSGSPDTPPTITGILPAITSAGRSVTVTGTNFPLAASASILSKDGFTIPVANVASSNSLSFLVPQYMGSGHLSLLTQRGKALASQDLYVAPYPHDETEVETTQRIAGGSTTQFPFSLGDSIGLAAFDGQPGQVALFNVVNTVASDCSVAVAELYAPDGTKVDSLMACGASGSLGPELLPLSGTYTLLMAPPSSQNSGTSRASQVTFKLSPVQTGQLTNGVPYAVNLAASPEWILNFSALAGQQATIGTTGATFNDCSASIALQRLGGTPFTTFTICGGADQTLSPVTLPQDGVYQALIKGQALTGAVNVSVSIPVAQTGQISSGVPVNATLGTIGQEERLTFLGPANRPLEVQLSNMQWSGPSSSGCMARLTILTPDHNYLTTPPCLGTSGTINLGPLTLPTSGTYTLILTPSAGVTGSATISLWLPTDQTGTVVIGNPTQVNINTPAQSSLLTFSGQGNTWIEFAIANSTFSTCNGLDISILGSDGTSLKANSACDLSGGIFGPVFIPNTENYTLKLSSTGSETGSASVSMLSPSVQSTQMISGSPISLSVTTPGQIGLYTFTGAAGQEAGVQLTNLQFNGNSNCTFAAILKSDGSILTSNSICNASSGWVGSISLPSVGSYSLLVAPMNGATGSGSVTLSLASIQTGQLAMGEPKTVSIDQPGQTASFTFTGVAGQQVGLGISNSNYPGWCNIAISVLGPNGTEVFSGIGCYSPDYMGPFTVTNSGTYTVNVAGRDASTGSFDVTLWPYSNLNYQVVASVPQIVNISTPGNTATLTFTATAGQQVSTLLSSSSFPCVIGSGLFGIRGQIRDSNGNALATEDPAHQFDDNDLQLCGHMGLVGPVIIPSNGTYSISLSAFRGLTGSVTATLLPTTNVTGISLANGVANTITTSSVGQLALASFSGVANQQVGFQVDNSTFPTLDGVTCPSIDLVGPNGWYAWNSLCNAASGFPLQTALPASGSYTVIVHPAGGTVGKMDLTLWQSTPQSAQGSIDTATPIAITTPGQNATVTFTGVAGQEISVQAISTTFSNCDVDTFQLVTPDNSLIESEPICGPNGGFIGPVVLPTSGVYKVLISPQNGDIGSASVAIWSITDITGTLTLGVDQPVNLSIPGQEALLTFGAAVGKIAELKISNSTFTDCLGNLVSIYDPNLLLIAQSRLCNNTEVPFIVETSGQYTVQIQPQSAHTGSVTLNLSLSTSSPLVTSIGVTKTVTVANPGYTSYLLFEGTPGQELGLQITNSTFTDCSAVVSITGPYGYQVASNLPVCSDAPSYEGPFYTYFSGSYTITVTSAQPGTATLELLQPTTYTGDFPLGTPNALTYFPGDMGYYTFTGTAGQQANLQITGSTFAGCTNDIVAIEGVDGTFVGNFGTLCNQNINVGTLPSTQQYYLFVLPQNADAGSANITLSLQ